MLTPFLCVVAALLLASNLLCLRYCRKRARRLDDEAAAKHFAMGEANANLLELSETLEAEKAKLAEANDKLQEQADRLATANLDILELKENIEVEKERSEKLLLNVLPPKVAQELKETGKAEPVSFEEVSSLFADIMGFTEMASQMEPKALINELNEIFTAFDRIAQRNGCVRIKTIGDAYLSVCGMPERDERHAERIVASAVEMIQFLAKRNSTAQYVWRVRIGAHTGKVVGGVVGVEKYIYDVFGDTINTTSRLEQSSEPMRITVSEEMRRLTCGKFHFAERGEISLKGKGAVKAFYVEVGDGQAPCRAATQA